MSATVYVGTLQEDLWSVAWRVQRLAAAVTIVVWIDDHGAISAAHESNAPPALSPAMLVGLYKPGASVRTIEDDLLAMQQARTRR